MNAASTDGTATTVPCRTLPYTLLGLATLLLTFGVLLGWAALAPLHSAVVAPGRIVVASNNKVIQHLDGGLVKTIRVADGDVVQAGQVLLTLDDQALRIRLAQVDRQLLATLANLGRLAAERDALPALTFADSLLQLAERLNAYDTLDAERQFFKTRRAALTTRREVLAQQASQAEKQLAGGKDLADTQQQRLRLFQEERKGLSQLADSQAVSRTRLRELDGRIAELRGEMASQQAENQRLRDAIGEFAQQSVLILQEYRKEVLGELKQQQSVRVNLEAEQRDLLGQLDRVVLRSPVAGKLKGLELAGPGEVIGAGQKISEIVPRERAFRIDAHVAPMDIDALQPGLRAEVRVNVFDDHRLMAPLFADLLDVSSDVYETSRPAEAFYKARLALDDEALQVLGERSLRLVSGMPVEVVIRTGERTLLDYLVRPLKDMLARAFNEA